MLTKKEGNEEKKSPKPSILIMWILNWTEMENIQ